MLTETKKAVWWNHISMTENWKKFSRAKILKDFILCSIYCRENIRKQLHIEGTNLLYLYIKII